MADIPEAMKRQTNDKEIDEDFPDDETLFRRVDPKRHWKPNLDPPIDPLAIALPEMSIGRSKYGHPEWLRLYDHDGKSCLEWAVIGFHVSAIIKTYHIDGEQYDSKPVHDPHSKNYPHTVVRTFHKNANRYIHSKDYLTRRMQLEWRDAIRRRLTIYIRPHQVVEIRQARPTSIVPSMPDE